MATLKVGQWLKIKGISYCCMEIRRVVRDEVATSTSVEWAGVRNYIPDPEASPRLGMIFTNPPRIERFGPGDIVHVEEEVVYLRPAPPETARLFLHTKVEVTVTEKAGGEQSGILPDSTNVSAGRVRDEVEVADGPGADVSAGVEVL